jgi:hypothetical protein
MQRLPWRGSGPARSASRCSPLVPAELARSSVDGHHSEQPMQVFVILAFALVGLRLRHPIGRLGQRKGRSTALGGVDDLEPRRARANRT